MTRHLVFRVEDLRSYVEAFFKKFDTSQEDAAIAADILISADLRGISSHGIIRLHTYYGDRLVKKQINPHAPLTVVRETPNSLLLDGENGLGQLVGYRSMTRCIEKANQAGLAMVTVRNSNHYGIAGYYAMMALKENMIGISLTNSQPLVAPTYGKSAILGTNPIAVAVPAGSERPYVLDMATSIVPIGRITVYEKAGKEIPTGWGIDGNGNVTNDPTRVLNGGALMPLGGTDILAGYKGYGLSLLVDILCGVLSGASFGVDVGHPSENRGANVGHFFAAFRVDNFRPLVDFQQDMDRLIRQLKDAPKAEGQERIYIHGEKEFIKSELYQKEGIPLLPEVIKSLVEAGKKVGLVFDLQSSGELDI